MDDQVTALDPVTDLDIAGIAGPQCLGWPVLARAGALAVRKHDGRSALFAPSCRERLAERSTATRDESASGRIEGVAVHLRRGFCPDGRRFAT